MDNISLRAVIRYLGLKGLTPKEIHVDMTVTVGKNAPSRMNGWMFNDSPFKKWDVEFKRGRDSLEDDSRQRMPVTVTTQETIAKIHDIIMEDRRVTEYYTAIVLGTSQDLIHVVIHNELHMSNVSARCVPKLLEPDLKGIRLNMSMGNLIIFRQIPTVFFRGVWLWMRPGSINSNQRQSNNRNSGKT